MNFLKDWVLNIVVIMIISIIVDIIMPNNSLKKYSKLIMGLIVMLTIIKPISKPYDSNKFISNLNINTLNYYESNNLIKEKDMIERKQKQQIIDTYEYNLKKQLIKEISFICNQEYKPEITINFNRLINSNEFATIENININLISERKIKVEQGKPVQTIKVSLESSNIDDEIEKEEDVEGNNFNKLMVEIKEHLHKTYGVLKKDININIKKSNDEVERSDGY